MPNSRNFTVRAMTRPELELAIEWAAREGWNPGRHDADPFFATDPHGFLIGLLDGEPICSVSAVAYGENFGFIGLYIVRPEFRGRGFGKRVWAAAMTRLGSRNIGLDGVVAQQENYKKSGFRLAYSNVRYEGLAGGTVPSGVIDLATVPFAQVEAFDREVFPASRPLFLRRWIVPPEGAALGIVRDRALQGYGVVRRCRVGFKIGPLFASSDVVAEDLFVALASHADGPLYLDLPEVNRAAIALAERHGMRPMFEAARMYTKSPPAVSHGRIFGVTTFELG